MDNFKSDYFRFFGSEKIRFFKVIKLHSLFFIYLSRRCDCCQNRFSKKFWRTLSRRYGLKYGLEFFTKNIGAGLFLNHAFNITINEEAKLGKNITLTKGCTIGKNESGPKQGCPIIGNNVYVGINSTIVGKIKIGSNVQIAPNTFLNCDVPDNAVVFGNPAIIKENRLDATLAYITNPINETTS